MRNADKIKVEAVGSTDDLNKLDQNAVTMIVDLTKGKPGTADFVVESPARSRVTITPKFPRIRLTIENIATKEQAVELEPLGLPTNDLVFLGASLSPERINVVGAESYVSKVKKARVLLYLSQIKAGSSISMPVELLDESDRVLPYVSAEPTEVSVTPAVSAAPTIKRALISVIWQGQPKIGFRIQSYDIQPQQLSVVGESALLARLSVLETEPLSLEGLNSDVSLSAKIKFPEGIRPAGPKEVKIFVHIVPNSAKESQPH